MKILVVDDADYMHDMLKEMLEGYELIKASNGVEALEKYREFKPDIVTMDLVMDTMNGIETIKKIIEYDRDASILVISAVGDMECIKKAIKAGAKDYMWKPFMVKDLLNAINKLK